MSQVNNYRQVSRVSICELVPYLMTCFIVRFKARLQPNIRFTLQHIFTRSTITRLKVNRCGWMLNLEVRNQGCEPVFCVRYKRTAFVVFRSLINVICNWQVMPQCTFSGHRKIQLSIEKHKRPPIKCCHIKQTDWIRYARIKRKAWSVVR